MNELIMYIKGLIRYHINQVITHMYESILQIGEGVCLMHMNEMHIQLWSIKSN